MRPAASAWEEDYSENLKQNGYERRLAAPTAFANKEKGVRMVVWGDDFTFLGRDKELKEAADILRQWYDMVFGPEPGDDKEVRILKQVVRWERDRITYEADEKHVHTVTKGVGLQPDSKGSEAPLPKDCDAEDEDQELKADDGRLFRKLAATVN